MTEMMSPSANADLTKVKAPALILVGDKETIFPAFQTGCTPCGLAKCTLKDL